MPVTFDQLQGRVRAELETRFDADYVAKVGPILLEAIVAATLKNLDMHVNTQTGEVYSPAPKPVNVFTTAPRQTGVHYRGQVRRSKKGYRR